MKLLIRKISSFAMALLVLFSTFSFTIDKHFCGDFLVSVSLVGKANGCGMEKNDAATPSKNNCCSDEVQKIEGQDELQQSSIVAIDLKENVFIKNKVLVAPLKAWLYPSKWIAYKLKHPPNLTTNFQISFQSFLI